MRRMKRKALIPAILFGAVGVAGALALGTTRSAQAQACLPGNWTASGCTYYYNHNYIRGGCTSFPGLDCYYCEYTCTDGTFDQCGENQAGTYSLCRKCASSGCEPFVESPMP